MAVRDREKGDGRLHDLTVEVIESVYIVRARKRYLTRRDVVPTSMPGRS